MMSFYNFRAVFEPECHCGILVDRHLADYGKPQLFVKLGDGERAVLDVFDEAFDDFSFAEATSNIFFNKSVLNTIGK